MGRQRKPGDCCKNCELRSDEGFCVDVLEPLRRDHGLRGLESIYMPDNAYCGQYQGDGAHDVDENAGIVTYPDDPKAWAEKVVGRRE